MLVKFHVVLSLCWLVMPTSFWETLFPLSFLDHRAHHIYEQLIQICVKMIRFGMWFPIKKQLTLYCQHRREPNLRNVWLNALVVHGNERGKALPRMIFQLFVSSFILLLNYQNKLILFLLQNCTSIIKWAKLICFIFILPFFIICVFLSFIYGWC